MVANLHLLDMEIYKIRRSLLPLVLDWVRHVFRKDKQTSSQKEHIKKAIHIESLRIQSASQMVIGGVYIHLLRKVFRFHYHSQKVIGSLGSIQNKHLVFLLYLSWRAGISIFTAILWRLIIKPRRINSGSVENTMPWSSVVRVGSFTDPSSVRSWKLVGNLNIIWIVEFWNWIKRSYTTTARSQPQCS